MEAVAPTGKHCSPDSEAIGVLTSSIGGVACLHFGAGMLVPGAAWGYCCYIGGVCALERACWCRCRVPLQGAAWACCCQSAAGCRCRVLLSGRRALELWQRHPAPASKFLRCRQSFAAAPGKGTSSPAPKHTQHSNSLAAAPTAPKAHLPDISTVKQQPAAPCSGTLQRHPAAAPCSGTLQRHPAAEPCSHIRSTFTTLP